MSWAVLSGPVRSAWQRYWFEGLPAERLAVFSRIVHATVLYTVFFTDRVVADKVWAPTAFYHPTWLGRVLHLPAPTSTTMALVQGTLLVSAVAAIAGVGPRRAVNATVAGAYLVFLLWAFGYSKVDHDQLTIVVALLVLVAVPGAGRGRDPMAGWALRTVQVAFLLAYPLSAISKLRRSGFDWMSSAVFARAIVRRGSSVGDWFAAQPALLRAGQWVFIGFEVAAVLALRPSGRTREVVLAGIVLLHLFTWATIGISFLPHTVCITAFLPLERLHPAVRRAPPAAVTGVEPGADRVGV